MALGVITNQMSLTAQRNVNNTQSGLQTSMARLSSGMRVNSARDDAAGLAIAETMNAQVRGMNVAIRNAGDAISLSQVAEGAMGQASDLMQRLRELAVQSANGTYITADRANLDKEFQALASEVTRVLTSTEFNGKKIVGADAGAIDFQIGANNATDNRVTVTTTRLDNDASITAVTGGNITTSATALTAITNIDAALSKVTSERAVYGAVQSRFESAINVLRISSENQSVSRGRIMDADFAAETASMSKYQVLQQAGIAMLGQANQATQAVLGLLK